MRGLSGRTDGGMYVRSSTESGNWRESCCAVLCCADSLEAQELYRLRWQLGSNACVGDTVQATVLLDSDGSSDGSATVSGVTFGIALPPGASLVSYAFSSTAQVPQAVFAGAEVLPTGLSVAILWADALSPSMARPLLHLDLIVGPGAVGSLLEFVDQVDGQETPITVLARHGLLVRPHVHSGCFGSGADADAGPQPTDAEWVVQPYAEYGSSEDAGTSAPAGAGDGGGFDEVPPDLYCQIEPRGTLREEPDGYEIFEVLPGPGGFGSASSIAAAFATAKASMNKAMVRVHPGTYTGELVLDVTGMTAEIIIASYGGPQYKTTWPYAEPNGVTIGPGGGNPPAVVRIIGAATHSSAALDFGWTRAIDVTDTPPDYTTPEAYDRGWRGFEVVAVHQQCVRVQATGCPIRIRGNYLRVEAPSTGQGVVLTSAALPHHDLEVFVNEIAHCRANTSGAGIAADGFVEGSTSRIRIINNYLHDNSVALASPTAYGGGVFVRGRSAEICSNWIYDNRANSGAGVLYFFQDDFKEADRLCFIHGNTVRRNLPFDGNEDIGGGIGVRGSTSAGQKPRGSWRLGVIRNIVHDNGWDETNGHVMFSGGGMAISVEFPDASAGPFEEYAGHEGQWVTGNTVFQNSADWWGGGVMLSLAWTNQGTLSFQFTNNTLIHNEVVEQTAAIPPAFPFWISAGLLLLDPAGHVQGNSCIVQDNLALVSAGDLNWFAGPGAQPFTYSRLSDSSMFSIVDLAAHATSSNAPATFIDVQGHQHPSSVTIDQGDPGLEGVYTSNPFMARDFDLEPRVEPPTLDIGADEFIPEPPEFIRGDCFQDSATNLADAITLLNHLFVPGVAVPPCLVACDFNDDGSLNIADPVYLLAYLFSGGPPPPSPFPLCGPDPTPQTPPLTCDMTVCP